MSRKKLKSLCDDRCDAYRPHCDALVGKACPELLFTPPAFARINGGKEPLFPVQKIEGILQDLHIGEQRSGLSTRATGSGKQALRKASDLNLFPVPAQFLRHMPTHMLVLIQGKAEASAMSVTASLMGERMAKAYTMERASSRFYARPIRIFTSSLAVAVESRFPIRGIRGSFFPNLFFLLRLRFADSLCE